MVVFGPNGAGTWWTRQRGVRTDRSLTRSCERRALDGGGAGAATQAKRRASQPFCASYTAAMLTAYVCGGAGEGIGAALRGREDLRWRGRHGGAHRGGTQIKIDHKVFEVSLSRRPHAFPSPSSGKSGTVSSPGSQCMHGVGRGDEADAVGKEAGPERAQQQLPPGDEPQRRRHPRPCSPPQCHQRGGPDAAARLQRLAAV